MQRQPILKITEIFPSIQGEGLRQGEPTIFIRLAGCNLRCTFCDTKYAWQGGQDFTAAQISEKVKTLRKSFPSDWVCLTGGEPLLQDLSELVCWLRKERLKIQVETNATIYQKLTVDWYSISPKPKKYFYRPEYRLRAKEVKLVVVKSLSLRIINKLRNEFLPSIPLILQPQSNKKWSGSLGRALLLKALQAGLKNIRLSYQLHKFYDLP